MSLVEVVVVIISVLLLLSRFLITCKATWHCVPRWVAVLLPPAILVAPQVFALWHGTVVTVNLVCWLIAGAVLLVVGFLPKPAEPTDPAQPK